MNIPKVSIISPIYKAEKYIYKCLESILSQTLKDWECILVDDGSPDCSGTICDEYSKKDSRFRVIHQSNRGVAIARQTGLDAAIGEYVIHIDPDDWVEAGMLSNLYAKAKEADADMVICDYFVEYQGKTIYKHQDFQETGSVQLMKAFFPKLHGSCWNKLEKLSTIRKYDVRFIDGINYCEDLCFNLELLKHDINVCYLPQAFYHYVIYNNPNSLFLQYSRKISDNDLRLFDILNNITIGTSSENLCKTLRGTAIVRRAFNSGLYSSKEFKQRYKKFWRFIIQNKSCKKRYIYVMACLGLYKPIFIIGSKLKQIIE